MSESLTVHALENKRLEIRNAITHYETLLGQARADLLHVDACLRLFRAELADGHPTKLPAYADLQRLYKHREISGICIKALQANGPLDTFQLTRIVMEAKGLDASDTHLLRVMAQRVVNLLSTAMRRSDTITSTGKRGKRRIWALPEPLPLAP